MFKRNKAEAPRRSRNGLTSHILLQRGDVADGRLSATWIDVAPGAARQEHTHLPEQVYVIIRGTGLVRVGDEEQEVTTGDLVYIPPNALHSIINTAEQVLSRAAWGSESDVRNPM